MSAKVWGLCLTGIKIDTRHKEKRGQVNAAATFSYLLPFRGELNAHENEVTFDIYGVAKYYRKTKNLPRIFLALLDNKCRELDIDSDGIYTSKDFDKDVAKLESQIKRGAFK